MRFGMFVPQGWRLDLAGIDQSDQWPTMVGIAQAIESLGYDSLWVFDHFHTVPVPTQEPTYEAWTLMASLAVVTETVRLGQMCTCHSYRPPSYLAKVAATVDVISSGRLDMGIGAGWYKTEYESYGYDYPSDGTRLDQLEEAVDIIRRMWTEDEVVFRGRHYQLDGAICQPKPVQQPHVPIWIAGGGEQKTLRVAARFADYTNFGVTLEEFRHKSEVLAHHCKDVGRNFDEITRTGLFNVLIGATEAEVAQRKSWVRAHYERLVPNDADGMIQFYFDESLAGTPEQIAEQLCAWEAIGMTYPLLVFAEAAYDLSGPEMFAKEVMPALS